MHLSLVAADMQTKICSSCAKRRSFWFRQPLGRVLIGSIGHRASICCSCVPELLCVSASASPVAQVRLGVHRSFVSAKLRFLLRSGSARRNLTRRCYPPPNAPVLCFVERLYCALLVSLVFCAREKTRKSSENNLFAWRDKVLRERDGSDFYRC